MSSNKQSVLSHKVNRLELVILPTEKKSLDISIEREVKIREPKGEKNRALFCFQLRITSDDPETFRISLSADVELGLSSVPENYRQYMEQQGTEFAADYLYRLLDKLLKQAGHAPLLLSEKLSDQSETP